MIDPVTYKKIVRILGEIADSLAHCRRIDPRRESVNVQASVYAYQKMRKIIRKEFSVRWEKENQQ